ncbi:hypothetical protein SCP_0600210 [Sparassis crispa]|uniref:Uncharacterized protein n=1 Tax=Sparassis crispa TaxID=139825 RepID=A0A401GQM1_9APHY|nr:hypothetical protein SCP_0600210 [Sparassis crispa]GBE84044.1 hypothetical protein SCP_0600210 [Sparassis crispa]
MQPVIFIDFAELAIAMLGYILRQMGVAMQKISSLTGNPWMEMFIFLDQKNPTWYEMLEEQEDDDISINSDSDEKQEDEPEEILYEDGSASGDY